MTKMLFKDHFCKHLEQSKIDQIKFETDMWKRLLAFMLEENICLKCRLVEILICDLFKGDVFRIEALENNLIMKDDTIAVLRNDLAEIDRLIFSETSGTRESLAMDLKNKLDNLRRHIQFIEKDFTLLKLDFNKYLLENA